MIGSFLVFSACLYLCGAGFSAKEDEPGKVTFRLALAAWAIAACAVHWGAWP